MSFYFIANNIHFTIELVGALVFFVMAWLAVDAYFVNRDYSSVTKILGFVFLGIWQFIHAFSFGGDIINFIGFSIYLLGLVLIVVSLITKPHLASVSAVILVPSFAATIPIIQIVAILLLGLISFLSYRQEKTEFNKSMRLFWLGFLFLTLAAFSQTTVSSGNPNNILWYVTHAFEAMGFVSFVFWVWQYLRLRLRESLVLIFISMTVFMATVVTLAFSTILISKIEQETRNNLLTNAKVFDFAVKGLIEESGAKSRLIANDPLIVNAISENDLTQLEDVLTEYLSEEHLGYILVTDSHGVVMMRGHSPSERGDSIVGERAVEEVLMGNSFSTIEYSPAEKFSIRAGSPVYKNGKVVGSVVAGFPLDNTIVDRIKKITGLDTTLYQKDLVVATTALDKDGRSRLTGVTISDGIVTENVLSLGENVTAGVVIRDTPFFASYIPIKNGDGNIVGMFSAAKPQADILDIANTTNRLTLVTVTILLLLLAFPVYLITKQLLGNIQI